MKHLYLLLPLIAVCAMSMLSACNRSNDGDTTVMDSVVVDKQLALSNDTSAPACKLHISLLYDHEADSSKARLINQVITTKAFGMEKMTVTQAVDSFTRNYLREYKKNFSPLYEADKKSNRTSASYNCHYILTSNVMNGRKGVMIYTLYMDAYEGGAHGNRQQQTVNFDIRTGKQLTLKDVFVPGYEKGLNELLLKALEDKTGAKNINELHNKNYLVSNDMYATENFVLNDGTVTFIYNAYEIAPYAIGTTELTLSDNDLSNLFKK